MLPHFHMMWLAKTISLFILLSDTAGAATSNGRPALLRASEALLGAQLRATHVESVRRQAGKLLPRLQDPSEEVVRQHANTKHVRNLRNGVNCTVARWNIFCTLQQSATFEHPLAMLAKQFLQSGQASRSTGKAKQTGLFPSSNVVSSKVLRDMGLEAAAASVVVSERASPEIRGQMRPERR